MTDIFISYSKVDCDDDMILEASLESEGLDRLVGLPPYVGRYIPR